MNGNLVSEGVTVMTLLLIIGTILPTYVFADKMQCLGGECVGTEGNDNMIGSENVDEMSGLGGNDHMTGKEEGDDMIGGDGNDVMDEGTDGGGSEMFSGDGNDVMTGIEGVHSSFAIQEFFPTSSP